MSWQPIETAVAVTPMLLWDPAFGMFVGFRYDGCWFCAHAELVPRSPTHWMTLPEPPETWFADVLSTLGESVPLGKGS